MFSFVTLSILAVVVLAGLQWYRGYRKYIEAARKTGLTYVLLPYPRNGFLWGAFHQIVASRLCKLPFTSSWLWLSLNNKSYSYQKPRHDHEQLGDTFFMIAPNGLSLRTSNAELSAQISYRRSDFVKPVRKYKILDIFGRSIISVEGSNWRRHRKVLGPSFSEKNNKLVFEESLRQTYRMLTLWESYEGNSSTDIKVQNTAIDTAVLSLHVICTAGFGLSQLWPEERKEKLKGQKYPHLTAFDLSDTHTMAMKESLHGLLHGIRWVVLLPTWLLRNSPFQAHKDANKAYSECMSYFKELQELKKKQLYLGEEHADGTMDLMGAMIRASDDGINLDSKSPTSNAPILSEEEIVGNSFIFFIAGHETTANSIHFSLLYLAIYRSSQATMQADIDRIVSTKPISSITYHEDMPRLYNSLVGAVLNEAIRLVPGIINVPKEAAGDQRVVVDGKEFVIPDRTIIQLNVTGTNRNPRYWLSSESKLTPGRNDLNDFVPERWLISSYQASAEDNEIEDVSFDTTGRGSLFKPVKGSFLSFSEGIRACPGRRFAQVEVIAVLTAIFQNYSVELDVGEWADDEEFARMEPEEKEIVYAKAVERANWVLQRCEQKTITLQMKKGDYVPMRFVKREKEMFAKKADRI